MGLDMYLTASRGAYGYSGKDPFYDQIKEFVPFESGNLDKIQIKAEIGYWRKANQIHKWFVDNVQDGEDDCREYWVPREGLIELRAICEEVLAASKMVSGNVRVSSTLTENGWEPNYKEGKIVEDPATALEKLPPCTGFFFGRDNIDELYIQDLKDTIEIVDRCLELDDCWEFEYQSSW